LPPAPSFERCLRLPHDTFFTCRSVKKLPFFRPARCSFPTPPLPIESLYSFPYFVGPSTSSNRPHGNHPNANIPPEEKYIAPINPRFRLNRFPPTIRFRCPSLLILERISGSFFISPALKILELSPFCSTTLPFPMYALPSPGPAPLASFFFDSHSSDRPHAGCFHAQDLPTPVPSEAIPNHPPF